MCVLRVSGTELDPRAFLRTSTIVACSGYLRGEPRRRTKPDGPKCTQSGFTAAVSEAEWNDLPAQCADAVAFIEKHEADLLRLHAMPEVEDMRLDFPIERRDVFVQSDFFPAALVRAAGRVGLGLELSVYPCAADDDDDDEGRIDESRVDEGDGDGHEGDDPEPPPPDPPR